MKVYLAYWCNNEDYEDYSEYVKGAYSTRESAIAAIEAFGYRKGKPPKPFDYLNKNEWHMPTFFKDGEPWGCYSMWVREMEVDA